MRTELKTSLSPKKTLLTLTLLITLSGSLCSVLGEIILPILVSLLALIFVFESREKRLYGYISSVTLVIINIATLLIGISSSFFSIQSIVLAVILALAIKKNYIKSNTAFIMTLICAVFSLAGYAILAMMITKDYSPDGVIAFYSDIFVSVKDVMVKYLVQLYTPLSEMYNIVITEEMIAEQFDQQRYMMISYIFITFFAVIGITIKIFEIFFSRLSEEQTTLKEWRFAVPAAYGYVYLILAIISIFSVNSSGLADIVISNLYNIFMIVFAYIGFNVVSSLLARKLNKFVSVIIPIGALMLSGSLACQLLSVIGVFMTINRNRFSPKAE